MYLCMVAPVASHHGSTFCQGSYGVVKLAYNEDDNTYYVSRGHMHTLLNLLLWGSDSDL